MARQAASCAVWLLPSRTKVTAGIRAFRAQVEKSDCSVTSWWLPAIQGKGQHSWSLCKGLPETAWRGTPREAKHWRKYFWKNPVWTLEIFFRRGWKFFSVIRKKLCVTANVFHFPTEKKSEKNERNCVWPQPYESMKLTVGQCALSLWSNHPSSARSLSPCCLCLRLSVAVLHIQTFFCRTKETM